LQHKDTLCFFLEHDVDADSKDAQKRTPMHRCAQDERIDLIKTLTAHNAQLLQTDCDGATLLYRAITWGLLTAEQRLHDSYASVDRKNNRFQYMLELKPFAGQRSVLYGIDMLKQKADASSVTSSCCSFPLNSHALKRLRMKYVASRYACPSTKAQQRQ
jgi:ankyrin repeat protein